MTEKQRELRPESAAEARRDLEVEARSLPRLRRSPRSFRRSRCSPVSDVASVPAAVSDLAETVTIPGRSIGRSKRNTGRRLGRARDRACAPRDRRRRMGLVDLLIPHEVDVPNVVGLTVDEAQTRLADAGLVVRIADGRHSTKVPAGSVLTVQPAEGSTLEQGDRVTLVPSLGPRPVPVPNLVGLPLGEAKAALPDARPQGRRGDEGVQRAVRRRPGDPAEREGRRRGAARQRDRPGGQQGADPRPAREGHRVAAGRGGRRPRRPRASSSTCGRSSPTGSRRAR